MTPTTADAMSTAHALGYVTTRSVKDLAAVAWYRHCREHKLPYIWVRQYQANAEIMLNLDTADRQLTPQEARWVGCLMTEHGIRGGLGRSGLHSARQPVHQVQLFAELLARVLDNCAELYR